MSNRDCANYWYGSRVWEREGLIRAVGFGGFLVVVGVIFAITPDLFGKTSAFLNDFTTQRLPFAGGLGNLNLLAPQNPAAHSDFYTAVMRFDIGIAILEFIMVLMRLGLQKVHRVAETMGNLVFWGGAAYLTSTFLLAGTLQGWFEFWAALVVLVGISMIVRGIVHFVRRK
ncbi:MAG TPA: hypothetical protein VMD05_08890 [Candidatus Nanoarchaeia archaeon]|nr:hypothetical protein [Candidatus Nanoarchaeia archaeon]